jgi:riboflavin kinase / FMN adenylyltransferase
MKIFKDFMLAGGSLTSPVVAIGIFDGVHVGHRRLIENAAEIAQKHGGDCVVLTMHPHPDVFFSKSDFAGLIADRETRLSIFRSLGVDAYVELEFTTQLASMSGEEFVSNVLVKGLLAKTVLVGFNFMFGRKRSCDAHDLARFARDHSLDVHVLGSVELEGKPVSSTRIREAVARGDMALAEKLLGRRYSLKGKVVRGDGVGTRLGFPTANLEISERGLLVPNAGVYRAMAVVDGEELSGLVNIGRRPTRYGSTGELLVEFHSLAPVGSLYGRSIELLFIEKTREELKFSNMESLRARIAGDVEEARRFFSGVGKNKMIGRVE